jgi:hypothetical protein
MFGGQTMAQEYPIYKIIVIWVLSQACSSPGCEHNSSVFKKIHQEAQKVKKIQIKFLIHYKL